MRIVGPVMLLLLCAGCAHVEVNVDDDGRDHHEKIFDSPHESLPADFAPPRVIDMPAIEYTEEMAATGKRGLVFVNVLVGDGGEVVSAEVSQGLHPLLDEAALAAVRAARYRPASNGSKTVEADLLVPVRFPPK